MTRKPRFSARTRQAFSAYGLPATLAVRAAAADAPAEILLYDEIGMWGVTAKDFLAAMAQAGAGPLLVRINSPGGDVFDGLAIYNALKAHPGGVTCQVDGLAASAASYIAMAGSTVRMADASMLMIHNAWGGAVGNKTDMTAFAGVLGQIDGVMAKIYADKTGKPVAEIAGMLDAETWMPAADAQAAGFCDVLCAAPDASAAKGATVNRLVAVRASMRAAFDPDGDGDDDAAEAIAAILAAQESLGDALAALTGAPDDDAGDADMAAAEAARVSAEAARVSAEAARVAACEKIALRVRIAVAQ